MGERRWAGVLALVWLLGGCCAHPGLFDNLERSLKTVQSYYEPLLQEGLAKDQVRRAVVAADTALLLAGELQRQWCPDPQAVDQLALQVKAAEKMAREAGVSMTEGQESAERGKGQD
jgi:hypothetical protein